MEKNINDNFGVSSVVAQTTENEIPDSSLIDHSGKMPIEHSFCQGKDNTYAVLVTKDITKSLTPSILAITENCIVDKITMCDFPLGQYTLSVCGQNVACAKYDIYTKTHTFDFNKEKSNTLQTFIALQKDHTDSVINKEDDSSNYLNIYRLSLDTVKIISPRYVKLNSKHKIVLQGYHKNLQNVWQKGENHIDVYPHHTYNLGINYVTDSITLVLKEENQDGKIILKLNGTSYFIDANKKYVNIKFKDENQSYNGMANTYLNEFINKNTLNFSVLSHAEITLVNCGANDIYQHMYDIYNYKLRLPIFAN